jgi:hypothetical protein
MTEGIDCAAAIFLAVPLHPADRRRQPIPVIAH